MRRVDGTGGWGFVGHFFVHYDVGGRAIGQELERDWTFAVIRPDHGYVPVDMWPGVNEAVVVEARPAQDWILELEADQYGEGCVCMQHDVAHAAFQAVQRSGVVVRDHLSRCAGNELRHEVELLLVFVRQPQSCGNGYQSYDGAEYE